MHYAKTAPAAMEERAERKSQNPAGSNISVIQHVESFLLRNQQKKSTALTAQKKSLSCLHYRFWNHCSLSDWACLPLQISASLPLVYFHLGQLEKRERLVKCCKTIAFHLHQLCKRAGKKSGWINWFWSFYLEKNPKHPTKNVIGLYHSRSLQWK